MAFIKIVVKPGLRPSTSCYYWRNFLAVLFTRESALETVVNLMAMYPHFTRQTKFVSGIMAKYIIENGVWGRNSTPLKRAWAATCKLINRRNEVRLWSGEHCPTRGTGW